MEKSSTPSNGQIYQHILGTLPVKSIIIKSSIKKANTVLDLKEDKVTMFDNLVELEFTSSGHYCILKINPVMQEGTEDEVLNIEHMEVGEKRKALIMLHKQFGHATYDRLAQLMNDAGNTDAASLEILRTICENCEI